jgi:hypothetical protein
MLSLLRKHVFDSSCLGNLCKICCCGNVFIRPLLSKRNLLLCEWPAPELMWAVTTTLTGVLLAKQRNVMQLAITRNEIPKIHYKIFPLVS